MERIIEQLEELMRINYDKAEENPDPSFSIGYWSGFEDTMKTLRILISGKFKMEDK